MYTTKPGKDFGITMSVALSIENPWYVWVADNSRDTAQCSSTAIMWGMVPLNQHRNTTQIKLKVYSTNTLF